MPATVRSYFEGACRAWAVEALGTYCEARDGAGRWLYSGAWFDRLAARHSPDAFRAEDIVAVSMLSVEVPAHAAISLLRTGREQFSGLLSAIGGDRPIWEADAADLAGGSPADLLWQSLCRLDGVGPVIAGKLMAAKRPGLIPIYDQHVDAALGYPPGTFWAGMRAAMEDAHEAVAAVVAETGLAVTPLRAVDIVVWMHRYGWIRAQHHLSAPPAMG